MPRNVRNFWIEGEIDGRASRFTGGPRNKMGGLVLTIFQRDRGEVKRAVRIEALAGSNGTLRLHVQPDRDEVAVRPALLAEGYPSGVPAGGFIIETER